tara:strand:+ start:362 stop:562 length:201 start_codon:yes stop_codon:yes gene_type:complete
MHTTHVNNFPETSASNAFANVRITVGEERHITTSMSTHGSEVTLFFDSLAEVRQFATDLLVQGSNA